MSRSIRRAIAAAVTVAAVTAGSIQMAGAAPIDNSSCDRWVRGIDVSNNNGRIDWTQVPNSGVAWSYAKATEGTWFTDWEYANNTF